MQGEGEGEGMRNDAQGTAHLPGADSGGPGPAHTNPTWWPASGTGSWFQTSSAAEGTSLTGSQSGSVACKHPRSTCSQRPGRDGGDRPQCLSAGSNIRKEQWLPTGVPPFSLATQLPALPPPAAQETGCKKGVRTDSTAFTRELKAEGLGRPSYCWDVLPWFAP